MTARRYSVAACVVSRSLAAAGLSAFSPSLGRAQQPHTYTLEDVLTSLRRGADTLDLARVSPVQSQALDSVSIMLRTAVQPR